MFLLPETVDLRTGTGNLKTRGQGPGTQRPEDGYWDPIIGNGTPWTKDPSPGTQPPNIEHDVMFRVAFSVT